jgi:hypothetical protein
LTRMADGKGNKTFERCSGNSPGPPHAAIIGGAGAGSTAKEPLFSSQCLALSYLHIFFVGNKSLLLLVIQYSMALSHFSDCHCSISYDFGIQSGSYGLHCSTPHGLPSAEKLYEDTNVQFVLQEVLSLVYPLSFPAEVVHCPSRTFCKYQKYHEHQEGMEKQRDKDSLQA